MSFSDNLKNLRAKHNMTQQMLADKMNVARTTITGYETKNRQPSHEKLADIAKIFGVTIDYLIDNRNSASPSLPSMNFQSEYSIDQQTFKIYKGLSPRSKEEVLRYIKLLDLWERLNKDSQ